MRGSFNYGRGYLFFAYKRIETQQVQNVFVFNYFKAYVMVSASVRQETSLAIPHAKFLKKQLSYNLFCLNFFENISLI